MKNTWSLWGGVVLAVAVSVVFPVSAFGECTERHIDCDARLVKVFSAMGLDLSSAARVTKQELLDAIDACSVCESEVRALLGASEALLKTVFKVIDALPGLDGIFDSACNKHNQCYVYGSATYGYSRNYCDSQFYDRMTRICRDNLFFLDIITVGGCEAAAGGLYGVVESLGEDAYRSSDKAGCCEYAVDVNKSKISFMPPRLDIAYLPARTAQCKVSPELEEVHALPDNETSLYVLMIL